MERERARPPHDHPEVAHAVRLEGLQAGSPVRAVQAHHAARRAAVRVDGAVIPDPVGVHQIHRSARGQRDLDPHEGAGQLAEIVRQGSAALRGLDVNRSVFGGEFAVIQTFADWPPDLGVPEDQRDRIMHVTLPIGSGVLMGSDSGGPGPETVTGNNFSLSLSPDTWEQADELFAKLSAGGTVDMPMQEMFWGLLLRLLHRPVRDLLADQLRSARTVTSNTGWSMRRDLGAATCCREIRRHRSGWPRGSRHGNVGPSPATAFAGRQPGAATELWTNWWAGLCGWESCSTALGYSVQVTKGSDGCRKRSARGPLLRTTRSSNRFAEPINWATKREPATRRSPSARRYGRCARRASP